ncbi:cathepsin L1-like [Ctenocephalides felis]|uniref:cathepsin L1-like n=1 Tax=Ctenocephalides felis TaxID=7515 RepID=UPI000E6E58DA|nr:cathepsin L1-like [Ctenocephalides felis]
MIMRHNQEATDGLHTYKLKENSLADLSPKQYQQLMVKLTKSNRRKLSDNEEILTSSRGFDADLPDEVDWRERGFITPPINQLTCGSCYAFSIVHTVQGQIFKQTGDLKYLSEQQIIDCSTRMGNYGCGGGSLRNTLRYIERSGGLMRYQDYPYNAKQNKCHYDRHKSVINITSWAILPSRDEDALENAVANIGPIAVSINASPETFQLYSEGIYDDIKCSSKHVNHAMLLVGYTKKYWILKNWWGSNWGENGFMKLRRNVNRCGVANYAAYSLI